MVVELHVEIPCDSTFVRQSINRRIKCKNQLQFSFPGGQANAFYFLHNLLLDLIASVGSAAMQVRCAIIELSSQPCVLPFFLLI